MLSYSLMTLVDTLFVGRFGAFAIAAVGLGGLCSFTLLTFAMGLLRGGKVIAAQFIGARRFNEIRELAAASLVVALVCSVGTWLVTISVTPLLGHVFHEAKANQELSHYIIARAFGIPLFLLATALREMSQGIGDSRSPMWAALAANLLNIPLNALFVLGLGYGVTGSAWANVFAQLIDLVLLAWLRKDWLLTLITLRRSRIRHVFSTGFPLGIEMFLDCSAFTLLGLILARLGAVEMAAHQIALQISHLSILPILALSESVSVLSGNAKGAQLPKHIPRIVRVGLGLGMIYTIGLSLLLLLAPTPLVHLFTTDAIVVHLTSVLLIVVAGFQLAFVFYAVCRAALRGAGDLKYTASVTVATAWLCTPPLGYVFAHHLGFGVVGGWCALAVEITCASALYILRLERLQFREYVIPNPRVPEYSLPLARHAFDSDEISTLSPEGSLR
jgi:MATE family multidrug resistance protein